MSDPRIPSAEQEANVRKLADYPLPPSPPFDEESVEIFALIQKYLVAAIAWADAERDRADMAERELKQWREWDDADDEWSAATAEAFPTRSGSHEAYATAMAMVSHRQSKGNLVELVNWLLVRITAAETREREAVASRDGQWRDALIAKGTAAESWAEHGPQNPDEAAIFCAEYDRVDGEYRTASVAKARANAFAEVVANLRFSGVLDPAQMGVVEWCANRIEELGKKGAE